MIKQYRMLKLILDYYHRAQEAVAKGVALKDIFELPVREKIGRAKYVPRDSIDREYGIIQQELSSQMDALLSKEGE
jgi:V/A-type H+-transporting ATPase subunit A